MREREEVQEVLRRLKRVVPASAAHTHPRRFRTDPSTPRKLNLRKPGRGDGIKCGRLQERNHQCKNNVLLFPAPARLEHGRRRGIRCRERLGGLLRYYSRAAYGVLSMGQ